ncbi:unnamed protein product, partial [marine sediment metagenome]
GLNSPFDEEEELLSQLPDLEARLRAAADDEVAEVASSAIWCLGAFKSAENVDFLLARLEGRRHIDSCCSSALFALGQIGDVRALDSVPRFTDDPRRGVRWRATRSLGRYDDERAARRLTEVLKSPTGRRRNAACDGIRLFREHPSAPAWEGRFSEALLDAARDASLGAERSSTHGRLSFYSGMLPIPGVTSAMRRSRIIRAAYDAARDGEYVLAMRTCAAVLKKGKRASDLERSCAQAIYDYVEKENIAPAFERAKTALASEDKYLGREKLLEFARTVKGIREYEE